MIRRIATLTLITVIALSCSKERRFEKRLDGTWEVERMVFTSSEQPEASYEAMNLGTVTFDEDGTGKNDFSYSYTIGEQSHDVNDNEAFRWETDAETVTIKGNANDGEKSIEWTVDNNAKDTQVWERIDDDGNEWSMTLNRL